MTLILCCYITNIKTKQINVFGKRLEQCSILPMTGYYRSGLCEWYGLNDYGVHTVCAQMTCQFLEFTRLQGNDLSTPRNSSQFPGLHEGDHWCLCAARWKEALVAKIAPSVILRATHQLTLQYIKLGDLRKYAFGNNNQLRIQKKT